MKKVMKLTALLCATLFSLTACVEENLEPVRPALDGDEIIFGARAGFEDANPKTKTVYSGETYQIGKVSFERIDWVTGDKIEIFCPQTNMKQAHYSVTRNGSPESTDGNSDSHLNDFAYLSRIGDASLQWNGDEPHTFYAMYPSTLMHTQDPEQTTKTGIYMNETTVYGRIPIQQDPKSVEETTDGLVCHPNMDYAYMVARSTVERAEGGRGVGLTFLPIVTALEIELVLPQEATAAGTQGTSKPVSIAEIIVEGSGIAGDFAVNLADDKWTETYPPCENIATGVAGRVNISLWHKDNEGNSVPRIINAGKSIKFTVFLRPGADINNLKITFDSGSGILGKTLTGSVIPTNKKTRISNLYLPAIGDPLPDEPDQPEFEWNYGNWMEQMPDEVVMSKLSLPGTGGSFSYAYDDVEGNPTPEFFMQQDLTFEEQWNMGIRAFEIVSDRSESGIWIWVSPRNLGDEDIKCNKKSVGLNVRTQFKAILDKVKDTDECAVVIFTYQPEGANPSRNAARYTNSLVQLYTEMFNGGYSEVLNKTFSPNLTLGEVRGKVMVIARVNQRNENDGGNFSGATQEVGNNNILLVDGCGTAKDRWGSRGYKINGSSAPDISNSASTYMEQAAYMGGNKIFVKGEGSTALDGTITRPNLNADNDYSNGKVDNGMNFKYETNVDGTTCWYQDWSRVIKDDRSVSAGSWRDPTSNSSYSYTAINWFKSDNEKLWNAKETFRMAISDQYKEYVFINSLCGYYDTDEYANSYIPSVNDAYGGDGGDIKSLATYMNREFYNFVLESGMDKSTGPTGIIMMDFVSKNPDDVGSHYLPGVIIGNNRKHDSAAGNNPTDNNGNGESGGGDGTGGDQGGTEG